MRLFWLIFFFKLCMSCGGKTSSSQETPSEDSQTWSNECDFYYVGTEIESMKVTMKFSESSIELVPRLYSDDKCSKEKISFRILYSLKVKQDLTSYKKVELTLNSAFKTIVSKDGLPTSEDLFGIKSYEIGKELDVTDKKRANLDEPVYGSGDVLVDIYSMGSSKFCFGKKKLAFGDLPGKDEDPTELSEKCFAK
jgi:hypothetical protein